MAAIFQADIWCDDCADSVKRRIAAELLAREGHDRYDGLLGLVDLEEIEVLDQCEESAAIDGLVDLLDAVSEYEYDSDEYPKGCDETSECDCPQHCAGCSEFLENDLTSDGADYVKETVRDDIRSGHTDSIACTVWAPFYSWIDWEDIGTCTGCGELRDDLDDDDYCSGCAECMACEDCND